jgi:hypothetical protein
MNESALRILVADLEASRSSFHWWLELFTALVAIGVVLEVVFVIWEFWEDLHDFRRGIVHPPEKPNVWLLIFGLFGASLVAVGVAGEFWEEAKIEGVETKIQVANDDLYLLLSNQTAELRRQNIENEGALEGERTARLELEAKVAWRTISPAQLKILSDKLRAVHGQKIVLRWTTSDPEQDNFGSQLAEVLGRAGLKVNVVTLGMLIASPGKKYPPISFADVTEANSVLAKAIEHALVAASLAKRPIPAFPPTGVMIGGDALKVVVGPKGPN